MAIKNKRILITAGPTWVAIDDIRVISNIASGETGVILAEEASRKGAQVTLFLGPVSMDYRNNSVRLKRFKYFEELKKEITVELRKNKYDAVIHSAAISDFGTRPFKGKLYSGRSYKIKLKPLPKIIQIIRRLAPGAKLVMFKLESGTSDRELIKTAREAQAKVRADFVVANRLNPYKAFIIDKDGDTIYSLESKKKLAKKLLEVINKNY